MKHAMNLSVSNPQPSWIMCQLGAREHYSIPRALHQDGKLEAMLTDYWIRPESWLARLPISSRLSDRYHPELEDAETLAPNLINLAQEVSLRLQRVPMMSRYIQKNRDFQLWVIAQLKKMSLPQGTPIFAYSYAADEIFRYAKTQGWKTVLGQFDPGPEEERLVQQEVLTQTHIKTSYEPVPKGYYARWKEEYHLADRVIVNSEWSKQCLAAEGLPTEQVKVIPLVYQNNPQQHRSIAPPKRDSFRVLFLGQINLRKGMARLLHAMELLRSEPIELVLAGPTEIDPLHWADLPNVSWVGNLTRSEVASYYQNSDAFILPTLSDGFAITQIEALSYGTPVIASKYCGQVVEPGRNGWILEDLEPATLARTLLQARAERPQLHAIEPPRFTLKDLATALQDSLR